MKYKYVAVDDVGFNASGSVEASKPSDAVTKLEALGYKCIVINGCSGNIEEACCLEFVGSGVCCEEEVVSQDLPNGFVEMDSECKDLYENNVFYADSEVDNEDES